MSNNYSQKWNIENLHSQSLYSRLDQLKLDLISLQKNIDQESLEKLILSLQELDSECQELESLILCLLSQNTKDETALIAQEKITYQRTLYESLLSTLEAKLAALNEKDFAHLLQNPLVKPISFYLSEKRTLSKQLLSLSQEKIIHRLKINGYQGWNEMYSHLIGQMHFTLPPTISNKELSVGQTENLLYHTDRSVRQSVFQVWEQTWHQHESTFSQILNHLAGFRLQLYETRNWSSPLQEPLFSNRMSELTLNAMWKAVETHKSCLVNYLNEKSKLLKINKLSWFDLDASLAEKQTPSIPYEEAAQIIMTQFNSFSPSMGAFAKKTFQSEWIDAEDRNFKRPGGFCTPLPKAKQSRIFMTYNGSMNNLFTLAHELGHAYHNEVIYSLPGFAQHYPMNVAETASTLAETIVIDEMIHQSDHLKIKKSLLDFKLQRAVIFLMNIHARFLFETRFYEERKKGFVLPKTLNVLMEDAQKEAYCDALEEWHPHFWIAKQHFYFSDYPFYNFPYTFGYLFSLGIYSFLKKGEGTSFQNYEALLKDTGQMNVEELALKHLRTDLTTQDFWMRALKLIQNDVNLFLSL